ncbi:MAG: C_GCAxxG_C_C family protein [Anaerolineae bacterium]|nr:C_GCAxxG_C_C family protein [Anaerolineae bacterium]
MKDRAEIATLKFLAGYNCAQSVVYSFVDDLQLEKETALKIACGFGAGMGRQQEVCGAVTGGIIVLGTKYGRGENDERAVAELSYQKVRALIDQFIEKNGTLACRNLLGGCDLLSEEGQKSFRENDLLNKVCTPCIRSAVEILEGIMDAD